MSFSNLLIYAIYWLRMPECVCATKSITKFHKTLSFVWARSNDIFPWKLAQKQPLLYFIYKLNDISSVFCVYRIGILMAIQNYLLHVYVFAYNHSLQITNNYWYNHSITDIISRCIIRRYENCFLSLNGGKMFDFHCDHAPVGLVLNNHRIPHIYFTLATRKW